MHGNFPASFIWLFKHGVLLARYNMTVNATINISASKLWSKYYTPNCSWDANVLKIVKLRLLNAECIICCLLVRNQLQ
jgi:hypothetical protein